MHSAQPPRPAIAPIVPAASSGVISKCDTTHDRLAQSRLGVYTGLFYALRAKHPPTAAHALRVALGCSKWSGWRELGEQERSLLEVAALLHDIGKIGIPDHVLQKPAELDGPEQLMMEMHCAVATELLRGAGASTELIELVQQSRMTFSASDELSVAARMLSIVDAFDSMTTEQVFRRALSHERAVDELFAHAGTQFDPELVKEFSTLLSEPRPKLEALMVDRWLNQFVPDPTPGFWESDVPVSSGGLQNLVDTLFHRRLLDALPDAAIYLDAEGQVLHWNRAAERLTGRKAATLTHRRWSSSLMGLRDEVGEELDGESCPLQSVITSHMQFSARLQLRHVDGKSFKVNFTALPVFTGTREFAGAIMLVRDASAQANLEERVQSLHLIASHDPLTKVANRAELDCRLPEFLQDHLSLGVPGSLIICDLDHFKRINDNYGHQAGDEALVRFAAILAEGSREGDLVARYGGEEFVVLCAGCDNPSATSRAEEIRRAVERTPIAAIENNALTASFGVTEIQPGDTATTLLARADRALLIAKGTGRNRVVQLGAGSGSEPVGDERRPLCPQQKASWLGWFRSVEESPLIETERLASVPHSVAIQKLQGFISDHHADVLRADEQRVTLRIDGQKYEGGRRKGERIAIMLMEITIHPVDYRTSRNNAFQSKTKLGIVIRPAKARDRRTDALLGQASQLLVSFNAYLVAQEITDEMREHIVEAR